jgi:hypothetical protein
MCLISVIQNSSESVISANLSYIVRKIIEYFKDNTSHGYCMASI